MEEHRGKSIDATTGSGFVVGGGGIEVSKRTAANNR
jgi:hypothetical protein